MAVAQSQSGYSGSNLPYPNPQTDVEYAEDLEAQLGVSAISATSPGTIVLANWVGVQSPSFPGYNGLGTTLPLPGSQAINSAGVESYSSLSSGLTAAADMLAGSSGQRALAPQFVKDLKAGNASTSQLISDVSAADAAGWTAGNYDANAISARLSTGGSASTGSINQSQPNAGAGSASLTGLSFPGGAWDPLNWNLLTELSSPSKGPAGLSNTALASGITSAFSAITGGLTPPELIIRLLEIVAGGILFAIGIFALLSAVAGKTGGDIFGAAKKGAEVAGVAALV